ncbi:MAG: hypothetical protein ABI833_16605 [Acidobacteriota bacterium]
MTDTQVKDYLRENGYPEHLIREGRSGLLRRWREFVERVERGYSLGIEDYRNDLDVRGIIALAKADDAEVHALDERLRKLLTATGVRVWESGPDNAFWDFGYPRNAGTDLLDDLRKEMLLL